jgi:hypothetical protein
MLSGWETTNNNNKNPKFTNTKKPKHTHAHTHTQGTRKYQDMAERKHLGKFMNSWAHLQDAQTWI